MSSTAVEIPGYLAGTWAIDPVHSEVSFTVRHMMVSKVRGRFDKFEGTIVTAENPLESTVSASVDLSSISTGQEQRDAHVRSADFFEVENHPTMTFTSTGLRAGGDQFLLDGDLTIKGVTNPITIPFSFEGAAKDPFGNQRVGFEGAVTINRKDYGITWNAALETGGVLVSDKVTLEFEVSAVRQEQK